MKSIVVSVWALGLVGLVTSGCATRVVERPAETQPATVVTTSPSGTVITTMPSAAPCAGAYSRETGTNFGVCTQ